MSDLPVGWQLVKLGDVADCALGKMLDRGKLRGHAAVEYLRNANVQWGHVTLDDVASMEIAPNEVDRYTVKAGDLLVCEGGEIGRAAIWTNRGRNITYQKALHRVRSRGTTDLRYIAHLLRLYAQNGTLSKYATGSTIKHLPQQQLKILPIPLPSMEEQRQIVEALEGYLSRLDAADAYLSAAERRSDTYREQVIMRRLLGDGQTALETSTYLSPAGTADGDLSPLPDGWSWRRLGELADVVGGVTKDAKKQSDPTMVEVPYLRVANVQRGRLDLTSVSRIKVAPARAEALKLLPGDVLMNEGGDRDKLARGWVWNDEVPDCIHQNHVFRARVVDESIEPVLLSLAANSIGAGWAAKNGTQSVNLASISLRKIKLMPVPVPPRGRQRQMVESIRETITTTEQVAAAITAQRKRAAALRRALLTAAFSGRLTGTSTDTEVVEEIAESQGAS